jgi:hypothetical protein
MAKKSVRVGAGAGMSDDRIPPAVDLVERGELDYLVCECLAERTIAREALDRTKDPDRGYTPIMLPRMQAVLPPALERGVRIITNMGAANPQAGAKALLKAARAWGIKELACAVVTGDDVTELLRDHPDLPLMEDGAPLESILPRMASANAYLGADVVRKALETGAAVVLTGRVADPSLFAGAIMHHLGWSHDNLDHLAAATVTGHMLECSSQVSGGCYADPGRKDVPNLADLGYPLADIGDDGSVVIGKTPGSGGLVSPATCTEQLLYEIHDPAAYITPDCILDVTSVEFRQEEADRVRVLGAKARERTDTLKVVVGYFDGYIGSGEITYAGINAVARAKLSLELVKERLKRRGFSYVDFRTDLIGMNSLLGDNGTASNAEPSEVRLRVAGRSESRAAAEAVGAEVRSLHLHGPGSGGGGINYGAREVLAVKSVLLPRSMVKPGIAVEVMQ